MTPVVRERLRQVADRRARGEAQPQVVVLGRDQRGVLVEAASGEQLLAPREQRAADHRIAIEQRVEVDPLRHGAVAVLGRPHRVAIDDERVTAHGRSVGRLHRARLGLELARRKPIIRIEERDQRSSRRLDAAIARSSGPALLLPNHRGSSLLRDRRRAIRRSVVDDDHFIGLQRLIAEGSQRIAEIPLGVECRDHDRDAGLHAALRRSFATTARAMSPK